MRGKAGNGGGWELGVCWLNLQSMVFESGTCFFHLCRSAQPICKVKTMGATAPPACLTYGEWDGQAAATAGIAPGLAVHRWLAWLDGRISSSFCSLLLRFAFPFTFAPFSDSFSYCSLSARIPARGCRHQSLLDLY